MKNIIPPFFTSSSHKPSTSLTFTESPNKTLNTLDTILQQIKIDNTQITSFTHYQTLLNALISTPIAHQTEHDYLLSSTKHANLPQTQKYIITGKIGNAPTYLDPNSQSQSGTITFNNTRVDSKDGFLSIRTNNCVIKGKYFYECELLSNGLLQIGWCQLTTPFTEQNGVGDDNSSYAYDGWRNVVFHGPDKPYGKIWDKGDIVGCCIDLNNKTMSFYLNGEDLGIAATNIAVGENCAYFPGCSLSRSEKCVFNFGQTPFMYKYEGYEPFDQMVFQIEQTNQVLAKLLTLVHSYLLNILETYKNELNTYMKQLLCYNVFDYIMRKGFRDLSAFTYIIVPYLYELLQKSRTQFIIFWDILLSTVSHNEQKTFVNDVMDNLTNLTYCYSLMGSKGESNWKKYITILTTLFTVESFVSIWITKDSGNTWSKQIWHLENIFHSNCIKQGNYYYHALSLYPNLKHDASFTVSDMLRILDRNQHQTDINTINRLDTMYSNGLSNIIEVFLTHKKTYTNGTTILKDVFNDFLRAGNRNNADNINDLYNVLGFSMRSKDKDDLNFYKNLFFNIMNYFVCNFLSIDFKVVTTDPWFSRADKKSIYYDEVGLGGTIAHVTNEYITEIEHSLIVNNDLSCLDFMHRLIKLCYDFIIGSSSSLLRKLHEQRKYNKQTRYNSLLNFTHGCTKLSEITRNYFHLMSLQTQKIFYLFSFFFVKYLTWLKAQNPVVLYFVPIIVIDLPYEMFKLLTKMNSPILSTQSIRNEFNKASCYFKDDDYVQSVLRLYLYLFSDNTIANPDIREKLLDKVQFIIKHYYTYFTLHNELYTFLIDGIINNMQKDFLSHKASKLFLKEIMPFCFGYDYSNSGNSSNSSSSSNINNNNNNNNNNISNTSSTLLSSNIKQYFLKEKSKIITGYINFYFPLFNKTITSFTIFVSEIAAINPLIHENAQTTSTRNQSLITSFLSTCDLLKILEFLLTLYPEEMFNLRCLIGKNFMNVIKILSNRIYAEPYLTNLLKAVDSVNHKDKININDLIRSTLGILLQIQRSTNVNGYDTFIHKIANSDEVLLDSFNAMKRRFEAQNELKCFHNEFTMVEVFIKEIRSKRDKKEYTEEEMNKLEEEDKICVICRVNIVDVEMLPCKHTACKECVDVYLSEKETCFICHQKVERVEQVDVVMMG